MPRKKLASLSPEIKRLQGIIDKQTQQIEDMRRAKFRIPVGRKKARGKTFVRLLIPDTHGAHLDKKAGAAFLRDIEKLQPAEIVWLGDHLDCSGFMAQHQPFSHIQETTYSYAEDIEATNEFIDQVAKRCGKVDQWYIYGNHEARVERWIVRQTLSHQKDASYLHNLFGVSSVLGLDKRGMHKVLRDQQYDGLTKRGTIRLGKCHFMHGTRCGINAAKAELEDLGGNVVSAHTHRIQSFVKESIAGPIGSWKVGCLCELSPVYGDTKVSGWAHGYGFQVVSPNGEFLPITVPIVDGHSLLSGLLK